MVMDGKLNLLQHCLWVLSLHSFGDMVKEDCLWVLALLHFYLVWISKRVRKYEKNYSFFSFLLIWSKSKCEKKKNLPSISGRKPLHNYFLIKMVNK